MEPFKRIAESIFSDDDYGRQMRFIAGPRQCGKTTMVKDFLQAKSSEQTYYLWDKAETRTRYAHNHNFFLEDIRNFSIEKPWLCFDEIHKVYNWKNLLKEVFDEHESKIQFLVTGSARLDLFRRSGDSLAGRYLLFHLFPFNLAEVLGRHQLIEPGECPILFVHSRLDHEATDDKRNLLKDLFKLGPFPEPFLNGTTKFLNKWQTTYTEKIIYEDLRDISQIRDLEKVAMLVEMLPACVSAPISINALAKRLELNFATAKNYLKYLELAYLVFHIKPYSKNLERSFKKEFKTYFFDWTRISDESKLFENYVAFELFVWCNYWTDAGLAKKFELWFVRNTDDAKETDFLITKDSKPWLLVEAKFSEEKIASHHYRHSEKLGNIPIVQITCKGERIHIFKENVISVPAWRFF